MDINFLLFNICFWRKVLCPMWGFDYSENNVAENILEASQLTLSQLSFPVQRHFLKMKIELGKYIGCLSTLWCAP